MQLQLQNFASLVGAAAAAVQGTARQLVDLTVGSTLRAVLEASASMALWVQWLIVQVLQTTRAGTSAGADLDSWMADFGVVRLPSVAASGALVFSRFVSSGAAVVPAGTLVRTADGSQVFAVGRDVSHAAWTGAGYAMAAGAGSVVVPGVAQVAGVGGNVQAGSVSLISAALPGVDAVGNVAAFAGGREAEGDAALRARFTRFLDSRSRATAGAIFYAIDGVQQGLQRTLQDNVLPGGAVSVGSFVVTVDDGSGAPSASLLAAVAAAVEAVRPVGAVYAVMAPVVTAADVSLGVTLLAGAGAGAVRAAVAAGIASYINGLGLGVPLVWSRLIQVAYDASGLVAGVSGVVVNGAGLDIVPGPGGVVKAGAVVVS